MEKILRSELIELNIKAKERKDAIIELTQLLANEDYLYSKDSFLQDVFQREEMGNTAVGFGVAIPHGKSSEVKEAAIVFGRSELGIDWNSSDGEPVYTIFLLAVPEEQASNQHLKTLATLSRSLMDEDFRQQLLGAKNSNDIINLFRNSVQQNVAQ